MDQDDSIMSTPSSHNDDGEDSLLPQTPTNPQTTDSDLVRAQTPQNDHLNAAAPGELSPPRSQTHVTVNRNRNLIDDDEGLGDDMPGTVGRDGQGVGGGSGAECRAGMWKTKKAQDEMLKVWETNFVDRDFGLGIFGDVLDHKAEVGELASVSGSSGSGSGSTGGGVGTSASAGRTQQ